MKGVVLITGCSSGIGRACARLFANKGWQVVATMRDIKKADERLQSPLTRVVSLDVSVRETITAVTQLITADYGRLDVVVNNAGFGAFGPFETADPTLIDLQIETNLKGVMEVTRSALPMMRQQHSGTIINIASVGGLTTMPLNAIYHATKYAVVGFTEGLTYELAPFGINAKFVAPGGVATDFSGRSLAYTFDEKSNPYSSIVDKVTATFKQRAGNYSTPEKIAEVVYQAATDGKSQVKYVAGEDAEALLRARGQLGDDGYLKMMQQRFSL